MKLTVEQEQMVSAFLRASSQSVQNLPPSAQAQTLVQVRQSLRRELNRFESESLNDEELTRLLSRMRVSKTGWQNPAFTAYPGQPQTTRKPPVVSETVNLRRRKAQPVHSFASEDRVWLGVCLDLSRRFGYSARAIRIGFVVGGLLAGPVALLTYLGVYADRYRSLEGQDLPKVDRDQLFRFVATTAAGVFAMAAVSSAGIFVVNFVYEQVFDTVLAASIGSRFKDTYLTTAMAALLVFLPLSTLASLPLAHHWEKTLSKMVKAGLALVAVLMVLGFASYLAGAFVSAARAWTG